MIVWRLQFPDGRGAYQGRRDWPTNDKPAFLRDIYGSRDLPGGDPHPAPGEDGLDYIEHHEFFGFVSPDQLLAWFYRDGEEDARRYHSRSMQITVWDVKRRHVRQGGRQCVFNKGEAQLVGRWNPHEFLDHFQPSRGSFTARVE